MADQEADQRMRDLQREYLDFLDDEEDQGIYCKRVKDMVENSSKRLLVNINDLRRKNPQRALSLLNNSFEEQNAFQRALKEYVSTVDPNYALENDEFYLGFEGSFGNKHVTPRTLTCRYLNNLICLEGIVTECSLIRIKLVKSVHYCPSTKKTMERRYTDLTSFEAFPSSSVYPTKDEDGNLLETEYGLSTYKDHQTLVIQEMPEKAPAGQLPRSVDVICEHDLADGCVPGDRVQIVGNFRCLPGKQNNYTTGIFKTVLIANFISQLSKDAKLYVTREDIVNCRRLNKRKNVFELLSRSLAPSIHGHAYVKKAILCLLLGGVEKILPSGTRLRGDVNVLLIGDPSVAKSQLLRYVLNTAPRAIATTGRGSSGVGLTAAVTSDTETGERRLVAGAMVLADRGVVCIDEFDKMSDMDRTAIHEVMEQGRVTIAKAGIQARLNARCSVLAAANPVYGKYDQYKAPMENIGLQDSLLSRFDLLFVMLDIVDGDVDSMISDHVVRMHRYRNPGEQDGAVLPMGSGIEMLGTHNSDLADEETGPTPIYEKYDPLLHGNSRLKSDRIFTVKFMRMYIHIAKVLKPVLTDEASELIAEEYSRLRSQDMIESGVARTQPVTVRTLETLIRLSTAHAKARLCRNIERVDAEAAIELVQFAYFKKVLEKEKKKRRRGDDEEEEEESEEEEAEDENIQPPKRARTERAAARKHPTDIYEFDSEDDGEPILITQAPPVVPVVKPTSVTQDRLKVFKTSLANAFRAERSQSMNLAKVTSFINSEHGSTPFDEGEMAAALEKMTEENQIMVADNVVFLI